MAHSHDIIRALDMPAQVNLVTGKLYNVRNRPFWAGFSLLGLGIVQDLAVHRTAAVDNLAADIG